MAKRSGYRIRLEWFVPFDPAKIEGMGAVSHHLDQAKEFSHLNLLRNGGMLVNIQTKYQARREVPDAAHGTVEGMTGLFVTDGDKEALVHSSPVPQPTMPPIPATMRRT